MPTHSRSAPHCLARVLRDRDAYAIDLSSNIFLTA